MTSPRYVYLWGMRSQFEAAFLRGYLRAGPGVSIAFLNWSRLNFLLCFWHTECKVQKLSTRSWVLNRMFAKPVKRLSAKVELEQAT